MSNQCCCSDNVLYFTTSEINSILLDSIINCSTRYSQVRTSPIQLTLEEALSLVPDKYKSTCRVLVFLNKDEEPRPEMWVYGSRMPTDWLNPNKWLQIPIGSSGIVDTTIDPESKNPVEGSAIYKEFQKVVYSDQVRAIKVVDKAPGEYDDILYLEYKPMDEKSTYQIKLPADIQSPIAGEAYTLPVNLSTYILGENGIDFARLYINTIAKPDGDSRVVVSSEYPEGIINEFVNSGYIGNDSTGFSLKSDEDLTISLNLDFNLQGDYTVVFRVINIDGGSNLAELQYTFKVI